MAGFDATYEGLQNMILRDKFFITCDKPLQTFLKEKGKLSQKEMTQAIDNYVEAHGHEINRTETKQNKWSKSNTVSTNKAGQNVARANTVTCGYCNMNGHRADNCRKRQAEKRHYFFKYGKQGHRQFTCPNSIEKTAAMQLINETLNHDDQSVYSDSRPHNCDESQGDGEVKLACGCMLPFVAGAFSHEGERKLKCICAGKTTCGVGSVNGHKVKVMRGTGLTTCVVKQFLVEAEQMLELWPSSFDYFQVENHQVFSSFACLFCNSLTSSCLCIRCLGVKSWCMNMLITVSSLCIGKFFDFDNTLIFCSSEAITILIGHALTSDDWTFS